MYPMKSIEMTRPPLSTAKYANAAEPEGLPLRPVTRSTKRDVGTKTARTTKNKDQAMISVIST